MIEMVEMLDFSSVGICCVPETRFRRKSIKMNSVKAAKYKLCCMGNEKGVRGAGIFWPRNG